MKTIKWGIIGCGDVTEVKSGPGFQKASNSALVAVMRRNGELAKDYAQRHNVPKWYDDADRLINDPEVDAVYIATPPAFHKEYVVKSARAGKPVYVEKPMALNYADSLEMVEVCRQAKIPLYVAFYRRAMEYYLKVKELVESKSIGDIRAVSITQYTKLKQEELQGEEKLPWRLVAEVSGGGKFYDLAPHTLDIIDFIVGPIEKAEGASRNLAKIYKVEDTVCAKLEFASGIIGTGLWCFTGNENSDVNVITGSSGKISFSTFGNTPIVVENNERTTRYEIARPEHVQQPMIQSVVNELNGCGTCSSNGSSALRTSRVVDEIMSGKR